MQVDDVVSPKQKITNLVVASLEVTFPYAPNVVPLIAPHSRKEAGDYQWYIFFLILIDGLYLCILFVSYILKQLLFSVGDTIVKLSFLAESSYVLLSTNSKFTFGYSNNAMSLWARIRNMGTEFTGPEPIGQVIFVFFSHRFIKIVTIQMVFS